jgi:hypothetical protein
MPAILIANNTFMIVRVTSFVKLKKSQSLSQNMMGEA